MRKENFKIAVALTSIMQAGLSVLVPPFLLYYFAKFLINKFGFSDRLIIFAIVLGVLSGFYNMFKFLHSIINGGGE